ncbi:MAG: cyclopropane-fatty-acyl-phospholipid synthase family protein [Burkholderiaceae bacterium]
MNPLLSALERKLASIPTPLQLVLPDGRKIGPADYRVRFTLHDASAIAHAASGQVGILGQDYVEGKVSFEGEMRDVMRAAAAFLPGSPVEAARGGWLTELIRRMLSTWRHSEERDARQIEFHYDLSDDFYALWLDPRRIYSCAYYETPGMSLAQAQEAKCELICRKLALHAGDRLLDVGAGWGGLLLWAAQHYGVRATGVTLSRNQHAYVNRLIEARGLKGQVNMELTDYRQLDESAPFDKISSIGMFEHVGRAQLGAYFGKLNRLLRPGGMILNHGITAAGLHNDQLGNGMGDFIEKYIFPGGELTHISRVLEAAAQGGLESVDVENLRPHYARTLWAWSDALEANLSRAGEILAGDRGARSLRAYRLYLAGCAMAFEHNWIALHQILAQPAHGGRADELDYPKDMSYPWRRDYIYR